MSENERDTAQPNQAQTPPPADPSEENNPAFSEQPKDAYTGRPDQGITANTGPGAGGATEWGGGNKRNPVRANKNVRQGGG